MCSRIRVCVQVSVGLGVSPLRGAGLLRCASSRCQRPSVSPLTGCHPSREYSQAGGAGRDTRRPFPCPGIAGSFVRHAAHDRRPLGDRAGSQVAALRSARCSAVPNATPVTRHARSRAAEDRVQRSARSGLAAAQPAISGSTAAPFAALGGTSAAEAPLLVIVRSAALQPLRQAGWHSCRDAAPPVRGQPVRQSSHRAPPTRPRRMARGTCGGIFKRWAGKPAHCFGCEEHHPSPTPSREGRGHAHPPPARRREQGSPSERISFQGTRTGTRLVALDWSSPWRTFL